MKPKRIFVLGLGVQVAPSVGNRRKGGEPTLMGLDFFLNDNGFLVGLSLDGPREMHDAWRRDRNSCDHFVAPENLLGNIMKTPMSALVDSDKQRQFGRDKFAKLPQYCLECPVLFACFGECPKNRFIKTPDGKEGLNYLCGG